MQRNGLPKKLLSNQHGGVAVEDGLDQILDLFPFLGTLLAELGGTLAEEDVILAGDFGHSFVMSLRWNGEGGKQVFLWGSCKWLV